MAVSNQLLVGTSCLVIIALVVAATDKTEEEEQEIRDTDMVPAPPTRVELAARLDAVENLIGRWDTIRDGSPSVTDLDDIDAELRVLNLLGQDTFRERQAFHNDEEAKGVFDNLVAQVQGQIASKRRQLAQQAPVVESDPVPQNAGEPKATNVGQTANFDVDEGGWPDMTDPTEQESFYQTPAVDLDRIIDDFSNQQSGTATTDPKDSAFNQAEDGLNVPENEREGTNKRAAEDDDDGFNESSAPTKVPESEPAVKQELNADPIADFESVPDPPTSQMPVEMPPAVPDEKPTHKEVLASKGSGGDPAFNTTDEQSFGQDNDDSRIDSLLKAREDEEDPEQQFEKDKLIQDTVPDQTESASLAQVEKVVGVYMTAVYDINKRIFTQKSRDPKHLENIKQYIKLLARVVTESPAESAVTEAAIQDAERVLVKAIGAYGAKVKPKRAREDGLTGYGSPKATGKKQRKTRRV